MIQAILTLISLLLAMFAAVCVCLFFAVCFGAAAIRGIE